MIHTITVLATVTAAIPEASGDAASSPGAFGVVVIGFLFVVVVLALLAAVTSAMGAWFTKQAASHATKAAEAAAKAAESVASATATGATQTMSSTALLNPAAQPSIEDDPELLAVVAAAVHTVFGDRPHRVVSVRCAGPGWAQEGRRQIFSSHRVR